MSKNSNHQILDEALKNETHWHHQDLIYQQARQASEDTGDRFVPVGTFNGFWAVMDAERMEPVSSGHDFYAALNKAEELSRLDKVSKLENPKP